MIVATAKPLEDVQAMVDGLSSIVLAGCNGCVTVCRTGGEKEVQVVASALRLARRAVGKPLEIREVTLERQCDPEYVEKARPFVQDFDAVLSLACGAGVQFMAERFPKMPVYPGVNTSFIGVALRQGEWSERCQACGDCVLHLTAGVCPVARCSKSLFHGPCGGSVEGRCEIGKDVPCGWQLIVDRLEALGRKEDYGKLLPLKKWRASRDGGPRSVLRKDLVQ